MTQRKETLVFTEKKPLFLIGNLHASLSYPVVYEKGRYLLEKTDYSEFIEPLLRTTLLPRRKIKNIVIDAGHGGKDQGASSGKILEKNLNLLMARKIAAILRIRGYQVSMTRTGDKTITLQERCDFATKKKPDLFLSIHCNSAEDASISGIEVFLANPPDVPSFGTTNIGKKGAATPFQQTSALWAFYTQKALLNATKATDRGIKRKQFKVIIDTPSPALLVELGFISNKDELQNLQKKDYQDKLADAICDSIDKLSKTLKPQNK
ncbi:MAG: N-acetylmuramoyl-L-alanine amidase [Lentisphaeria bacterium]|nr:N-acetylmuramoyl-L-alanine amidase [Lentisphaeria bacterium]